MPTDDSLTALLGAPPRPPTDPDLFSSNPLFGEPGIYPQGTPMAPARGPATSESAAVAALAAIGLGDAAARLAEPALCERAPEPGPRAGLLALSLTVAAPLLDAFVAGTGTIDAIGLGPTASPGRIVGPPASDTPPSEPASSDGHMGRQTTPIGSRAPTRVVNERYAAEHPVLLAGSLAHDLLWSGPGAGQYEEVTLHALCALVHVQLLARAPFLARLGTELARRQNSLAVTLLNSRHPGCADLAVRAPDGPGTIPGGAPTIQTPDFWNIPFVSGPPATGDVPALLAPVLRAVTGTEPPSTLRYDDALGEWWSARGVRGALSLDDQWRAAHALGLVGEPGPPS